MSRKPLEMTEFSVEKLQCIGSSSNTSPYRITTYRGIALGSTGHIADASAAASNQSNFQVPRFQGIKRLLSAFSG